jgi:5'-nucleotidase
MMKRVLVDMDGVLADVYKRFFELHEQKTGKKPDLQSITGLKEAEAFPDLVNWVETPGFFRSMPVMKDSREILEKIARKYEVIVTSMATEFPASLTDKQLWLADHYPFISWQQIVFCGRKELIKAEIMIDDHLKNLDKFSGDTILFTQPHNININGCRHRRVNSWRDIERILL